MRRAAALLVVAATLAACASGSRVSPAGQASMDDGPRVEDALAGDPELLVVVRPARLERDPLYGPVLRLASRLASERAAVASAVGTTALAALEHADEVLVGLYDAGAGDAVVAVRGVPADVEPERVVDTHGAPLWAYARTLPRGVEELSATDTTHAAALFVLPRRAWIIAWGAAAASRVRETLLTGAHAAGFVEPAPDALAAARVTPSALERARPGIERGPLAPIVQDLDAVVLALEPGPEGQVGEVSARFLYGDETYAVRAEPSFHDVLAAFTRAYERRAPWLHAITIVRGERSVVVRGRIPRAWADGFLHPDLAPEGAPERDPARGQPDASNASKFRTIPFDRPKTLQ